MTNPSPNLSAPLSEAELSALDDALLDRFDEDSEPLPGDEGIINVSELDGLLTAVVSSPVMIMPSTWIPAVWGDYPPMFESETEVQRVYSLMIRQMNAIEIAQGLGASLDTEARDRLAPIRAFTEAADWPGHDLPEFAQIENLQHAIPPNVRWLHAYWLERRIDPVQPQSAPYQRSTPRVGRNDPCPCGSGKKFKKCCLH
jgi:uncharacterized protein